MRWDDAGGFAGALRKGIAIRSGKAIPFCNATKGMNSDPGFCLQNTLVSASRPNWNAAIMSPEIPTHAIPFSIMSVNLRALDSPYTPVTID